MLHLLNHCTVVLGVQQQNQRSLYFKHCQIGKYILHNIILNHQKENLFERNICFAFIQTNKSKNLK